MPRKKVEHKPVVYTESHSLIQKDIEEWKRQMKEARKKKNSNLEEDDTSPCQEHNT